ncbi:class I SAM-dependent methyltransferase [Actinopolymorpha sp. B17G11]|uniref:class I SAM-dependent methyltransferase n=1 Tax=Actinopolymorpha sp. B17G11 TaxID=3160861 RepID=UPI0032E49B68
MTEPSYLLATRAAYDTVAVDYAELLEVELGEKPLDRAFLAAFAELVQAGGAGAAGAPGPAAAGAAPVADLGCGPGRVTAYLDGLGLRVFGVDLSPAMIEVARQAHPHLRFEEGSLADLDVADGVLGGIVAWYSIIHTPPEDLPRIFAEFHRVLRADGQVLLAFQAGDERVRLEHAYGHAIELDAYRLAPDRIAALLAAAGFVVYARTLREPSGPEKTQQAFLMARKQGTTA